MTKGTLVIVGSGIKSISHITIEAKKYIEQSEKVLYLLNEPSVKEWVKKLNPNSESLDSLYTKYVLRKKNYDTITNYILETLSNFRHLCVVVYGHPTFFCQPAINAIILAREKKFNAFMLPAVSSVDCLFSDLLIDPGFSGCQIYDATDFLINNYILVPTNHVIFLQIGAIGSITRSKFHSNKNGALLFQKYLLKFYSLKDKIILYEAALYPTFKPKIIYSNLLKFPAQNITPLTTLYIPPRSSETLKKIN